MQCSANLFKTKFIYYYYFIYMLFFCRYGLYMQIYTSTTRLEIFHQWIIAKWARTWKNVRKHIVHEEWALGYSPDHTLSLRGSLYCLAHINWNELEWYFNKSSKNWQRGHKQGKTDGYEDRGLARTWTATIPHRLKNNNGTTRNGVTRALLSTADLWGLMI